MFKHSFEHLFDTFEIHLKNWQGDNGIQIWFETFDGTSKIIAANKSIIF